MVSPEASQSPPSAPPSISWRQVVWISLAAAALIAAIHLLPGPPLLSPMDFVPGGPDAVEFCDPLNPRVIAVAAKRTSVTLSLAVPAPLNAGSVEPARVRFALRTASGKAIGPDDLVSTPGGRIRLFILSAGLSDLQTAIPAPERRRGDWAFDFVPRMAGSYRVFADMTPAATGRELYASADLPVSGAPLRRADNLSSRAESGGIEFDLQPSAGPLYAHRAARLRLAIARPDGNPVPLVPFQGAYAHLVLFDEARVGFLRVSAPAGRNGGAPDALRPTFESTVTFPDSGRYVAWVIVDIAGHETEVPLAVEVTP